MRFIGMKRRGLRMPPAMTPVGAGLCVRLLSQWFRGSGRGAGREPGPCMKSSLWTFPGWFRAEPAQAKTGGGLDCLRAGPPGGPLSLRAPESAAPPRGSEGLGGRRFFEGYACQGNGGGWACPFMRFIGIRRRGIRQSGERRRLRASRRRPAARSHIPGPPGGGRRFPPQKYRQRIH